MLTKKLNKRFLPTWADLITVRNNRIIGVDWEGDFLLKEALDKPVDNYREVFRERSRLYRVLQDKRVILDPSYPGLSSGVRSLVLPVYERKKRIDNNGLFFRGYYQLNMR